MSERKRKDELKEAISASPKGAEREKTPEEVSRRAFVRRTAEAAAFSLFGVLGLDAVVEKVLQEMSEISSLRSLARTTGEILHEAGIRAMAFAAEGCNCPGGGGKFTCPRGHNFTCPTSFTCPAPLPGQLGFQCNISNFECTGTDFACTPSFFCENGYLCPRQNQYAPDCSPTQEVVCGIEQYDCYFNVPGIQYNCGAGTNYDCNASDEFNLQCRNNAEVQCPTDPYRCGGGGVDWIFDCSTPGLANSKFSCLQNRFDCNGGTLYDFRCMNRFSCAGGFECQANHVFGCGWDNAPPYPDGGSFECAAGANFTCAAGGNRCNTPGTGTYNIADGVPGDFRCIGAAGTPKFQCTSDFDCVAVDDFICTGVSGEENFVCVNPTQFTCASPSGGSFVCNQTFSQYSP
jgi:hypothetical protein